MATVQEFFHNPLVTWVTSFRTSSVAENINDFANGVFLNEVMVEIDPTYFTLTRVHQNVDGDVNVRIQNLDFLVRHLKAFYQEKLQQLVLMRAPDVVAIAHCPDTDVGLQELIKLLLLMLGCAVQCDNKESFIEKIKNLDLEVQKHLVEYIKEITENANHVLTFRMNELQDSTIDHVLVVAESMFYQMGQLIDERDQSFTDNTHLKLEKDMLLQERQRAKSPRPFSPPPSTGHLAVDSPSMAVSKERLRMLTEEMEEKNSLMAELKDELLASKKMIEKLRQENKDLSQDAVLVKAFRDQIDVLKVKADRVEKLETDVLKFKEKLRDLEYLKKRAEELKEENVILLDNRQLLREQLSSLSNKEERIEILEEENKKLKTHIHHIAEERQFEQEKLNEVMATNAQLNIEKQESMAEFASLTAEIDALRGKSLSGSVNLASECQESSSMDVLRLSHQNEHLKKSLEDLRSSSTKLIELERENRALHQKYLEEKSTVRKLSEELSKAKGEVKEKLKDAEGKELSMTSLKERVVNNEKQLVALDNKNRDKDMVLSEKQRAIEELSESLHDKDRHLKGLQSRLNESTEDQTKAESLIRKQKKEIAELENRLEEEAVKKKKYEETLKGKENEIIEYTQRFEEYQTTKMRTDDSVKKKDKELYEFKNKFQVALDECERLKDTLNGRDQKIAFLQKRVEDLLKVADENSETFSQNIREKERQNRHFERRIEELMETVNEVDKMKETIKQKEDKINSLIGSFNQKEDQVRDIESRLEDASSEINKLGHTIKLKDKKIEALESSLTEFETSSFVVKDDRVTEMKRTVEVRDNRIVELENKLEDLSSLNNKLQHSMKLKESRMTDLELRVEEIESLTSEKNRLTQNLEQKMKQIIDLESSLEDFKDENLRLQHNLTQKSHKVKELETKIVEIEGYVELSQSLQQSVNNKDGKLSNLNSSLQEKEEQLAEMENGLKESQAQIHKLKHIVKIKDEKILALESSIEEFETVVSDSKKLAQMNQSKEDKIKALESKLEELESVSNANEKLQKSLLQKEEKINRLQERLDDVEDAVSMNNKLNQHLKHRDNKIKVLGKRILELEEAIEAKEKEQIKIAQTNYTRTRELETRLEEYVQEREAKVVALQSKLDGSFDRYRQMDMTIGEKEMKIAELEAKLTEANEACRENNKLSQMLKAKDARLTELDNKIQMLETSSSKCERRDQERNDKLEILQKRLEETLNLNNKLDKSVRKKEENIRLLEKTLQANERREEELQVILETRTEKLSESKNRVVELNDVIENKDNEIEELNKRINELCNATTSDQKTTTLLKEKDNQIQFLTERLEYAESDKTKILRTLKIKEKEIEDLEHRVTSSTVRQHETRVTVLTQNTKKLEDNIFSLESQLEDANSQVNSLSRKLEQKDERIKGLKNRLEEAVHQNNKLTHALDLKEDKIKAVEERLGDASKQMMQLREENQSRATGRDKENKQGKASSTIIFKPAYNSRDDRKTVHMLSVADKRIADLNDEIRVLEKQNATISTQSEGLSSRNAQLEIENESLHNELRMVRGDFLSLQSELNEARDYYHQLDLSSVNLGHRCEMLSQLNATLEEENKALHDKVSWLMGQNRELMVKNLEEKDQFMEEERLFSDKLYNLQRTKERLEDQIDLANKALSEVTPKKKPGFFKKIFKKSAASKKKEDIKGSNKSQVQLLRVDYHDKGISSDDSMSYLRAPSDYLDESSSSSIGGDSNRSSKGLSNPSPIQSQTSIADVKQRNFPSVMNPEEEIKTRKISHDMSAFRARQVRSEVFGDNLQTGKLNRPKSLDSLNKLGGFRGSSDALSSASATTMDNFTNKNNRRGRTTSPPPSPPGSAFRVVQRSNGSPYSSPINSRRENTLRSSPPNDMDFPRKNKDSPDSSQFGAGARASSPSPSGSRSRRSSFSSAVSGHESDHESDRKDDSITSKCSGIAERTPPPAYHGGVNSSFRPSKSDEFSNSPQLRRSSRGPPPPYQKAVDEVRPDESQSPNQLSERKPPPYPEASRSQGFKRTPSIRSKAGTPREDSLPPYRRNSREASYDKGTSPREEQRPRSNQSTPQYPRPESLSMDAGSPINRHESSIDDEPEVLIDATKSTVSAVSVASKSLSQPKDDGNTIISTFFQPVEPLRESPLRRMNSMSRYNVRTRSIEEPQGRPSQSVKTTDTLFAAVLVRQRSLSDDPRRSRDLSEVLRTNRQTKQPVPNMNHKEGQPITKASSSLEKAPISQDEDTRDEASVVSSGSHEESGSEGRSKSRSGSRTPLRGKSTHQWLEYGCV